MKEAKYENLCCQVNMRILLTCAPRGIFYVEMAVRVPDPVSSASLKLQTELWSGGPSPGTFYHFPAAAMSSSQYTTAL